MNNPTHPKPAQLAYIALAYLTLALFLAFWLSSLRFDDPYITYRYAENLASGRGFVFNPGEATLITTAPLYAVLLAAGRFLGADIPTLSHTLSFLSLGWGAFMLGWLTVQASGRPAGWLAGLFFLFFPLNWLTIGFETPLFIALVLTIVHLLHHEKVFPAGLLMGVACGLRGDAFLLVLWCPLVFHFLPLRASWRNWRVWVGSFTTHWLGGIALVYVPFALWLTAQFGSPLPSTLQSKTAQAVSGLTGFYEQTSFPAGLGLLTQAYITLTQAYITLSPLLPFMVWVMVFLVFLGLGGIFSQQFQHKFTAQPLALFLGSWGLVHFVAYTMLGVAPYVWYYAPLVPTAVFALSIFFWGDKFEYMKPEEKGVQFVALVAAFLPLLVVDWLIFQQLQGAIPPPAAELTSKVLPEAKVDSYELAGRWLAEHTPPNATVGVTELGVMSYFANRPMVDFLGLTRPEQLQLIRHADYMGLLLTEQPDYLVLTAINAVYGWHPPQESWFTQLYTPVHTIADERFWGSPLTIWQRHREPLLPTVSIGTTPAELGQGWQINQVWSSQQTINGGGLLHLRVELQAGAEQPGRVLRLQPVRLGGGDLATLPVVSRAIFSAGWQEGERDGVNFVVQLPPEIPAGVYGVQVSWEDTAGQTITSGWLKKPFSPAEPPAFNLVSFANGGGMAQWVEPLKGCANQPVLVPLWWQGFSTSENYTAFVHVRNAAGETVAQTDGPPVQGQYPTFAWAEGEWVVENRPLVVERPGEYALVSGLYLPDTGQRLAVAEGAPGRVEEGAVQIGSLVIESCAGD